MNVSPLDLRQQRFRAAFRGFDRIEVTSFLAAVADDYEQALRETDRLKQDIASMESALNEHREHDKNLRATLTTAQKLSDDIKINADLEARRIIREAEGRSDLLLEKTQARLEDIQREIDGLKLKRRDVETSIVPAGVAPILRQRDDLEVGKPPADDLDRPVARAVVDHDDGRALGKGRQPRLAFPPRSGKLGAPHQS